MARFFEAFFGKSPYFFTYIQKKHQFVFSAIPEELASNIILFIPDKQRRFHLPACPTARPPGPVQEKKPRTKCYFVNNFLLQSTIIL